jgi:hypothetical protein
MLKISIQTIYITQSGKISAPTAIRTWDTRRKAESYLTLH